MDYPVQVVANKSRGQKLFKEIGTARVEGGRVRVRLSVIPAKPTLFIEGLELGPDRGRGVPVTAAVEGPAGTTTANLGRALRSRRGTGTNLLLDAVPPGLEFSFPLIENGGTR
ncbi:hypothetical protein [Oceanithermus sp.]|uniref:hypothetical protein n=1 Tax=Oceanithermus sp. TaxID=2268145 RepID=UPI00257A5895|nr:hypothetical protein [Oceanithermus sp.]